MARKCSGKIQELWYPDEWTWGKGMLVRSGSKNSAVCVREPYELTEEDQLSLRVTLKVWGGSAAFLMFETPEARKVYIEEDSRRVTWRNAAAMAEVLWRNALCCKEFVVFYCSKGQFGENEELIRIYQRLC